MNVAQRAELRAQLQGGSDASAKARLEVALWAAEGRYTLDELAAQAGRARSTVQAWLKKFKEGGIAGLLEHDTPPGSTSPIAAVAVQAELKAGLKAGRWRSAFAVAAWLKKSHGIERSWKSLYYWFKKLGYEAPRTQRTTRQPR